MSADPTAPVPVRAPARVLLVDDHHLVRVGLTALLDADPHLQVCGQAADGSEALAVAREVQPDVVVMDLSMPVLDGVGATRELVAEMPDVRVVVLTSFVDVERVHEALGAGAIGYVLKDSEPAALVAAVRAAAEGQVPLDPRVAGSLLPGAARRATAPGTAGAPATTAAGSVADELSPREREVLLLLSQGLANKQIARRLGITERTVKAHVGSVFRRLDVADRTSAALWAREHLPAGG